MVVKFHGVNAHAAGNPEDGINALDAVIQAFNAIAAMRQQMKQTWRVHGIILKGGTKPNIIPDLTVTEWYAREHQRFLRPAQHGRLRRLVISFRSTFVLCKFKAERCGGTGAPTAEELEELKAKLNGCFEGAALQTGCTADIEWNMRTPCAFAAPRLPFQLLTSCGVQRPTPSST